MKTYSVMIMLTGGSFAGETLMEQHIVQGDDEDQVRGVMVAQVLARSPNLALKSIQVNEISATLNTLGWFYRPDVIALLGGLKSMGVDEEYRGADGD